jgi:hypothetical protein
MKFKPEPLRPKPDIVFTKEKRLEKDCIALWKEKDCILPQKFESTCVSRSSKAFKRTHTFEWDLFHWADSDFVHWVDTQPPTMVLAVMANMKQSPRLNTELEKLRQQANLVPLYSMESYFKKKRLGQRSIQFIKEMKKKYGDSILRILFLTSEL